MHVAVYVIELNIDYNVVSCNSIYPDCNQSPPLIPFAAVNKRKRQREDDTENQRLKVSYPTPEIESFSTGSSEVSFQEEGSHH